MEWSDVLSIVNPEVPATTEDDVLVVTSATDTGAVVGYIQDWFGRADDRAALRLVMDGVDRGVITRASIYDLTLTSDRGGLGAGDYSTVPGHSVAYVPLLLVCPVPECHVRAAAVSYDPDEPPQCGVHGIALRLKD